MGCVSVLRPSRDQMGEQAAEGAGWEDNTSRDAKCNPVSSPLDEVSIHIASETDSGAPFYSTIWEALLELSICPTPTATVSCCLCLLFSLWHKTTTQMEYPLPEMLGPSTSNFRVFWFGFFFLGGVWRDRIVIYSTYSSLVSTSWVVRVQIPVLIFSQGIF